MDSESCWTELCTQLKIQDSRSNWETKKKMGRRYQRIPQLEENETENSTESDNKYNKSWIKAAKYCGRWTLFKNEYTMIAEERSENNARHRRNCQSRPARYVDGVRLSDDEVANITQHKVKAKLKRQKWSKLEGSSSSALRTLHVAKLQAQANVREKKGSRTSWWIDDQELRDGLTERKLHGERILWGSRYGRRQPRRDQDGIRKFVSPIPTPERWKSLRSDWWATVLATLFFFLFSSLPCSLRFVAQNLRIPVISNSVTATVCVWLIPQCFCVWSNYTMSSTVCKCTLCQQRKSVVSWPSLTLVRPGHWQLLDGLLWVSLSLSFVLRSDPLRGSKWHRALDAQKQRSVATRLPLGFEQKPCQVLFLEVLWFVPACLSVGTVDAH